MCDKYDRAIISVFCHDLHLISLCSGLLQNDLFKRAVSPILKTRVVVRFWETAHLPLS